MEYANSIPDWESLIAARMRPCIAMPKDEDASKRAKRITDNRYAKSEKRRISRKAWTSSPAGKLSQKRRDARYRATEKGKANDRRKANKYYETHKGDAGFKAKRNERRQGYRCRVRIGELLGEMGPIEGFLAMAHLLVVQAAAQTELKEASK